MLDWNLLSGPLPVMLNLAAAVAGTWLLTASTRPGRRTRSFASIVMCAVLTVPLTLLLTGLARNVWMHFADQLPLSVHAWLAIGVFTLAVTVSYLARGRAPRSAVAATVAAVVVLLACANHVNAVYGAYLTPRDALQIAHSSDIALRDTPRRQHLIPDTEPVAAQWDSPAGLPVQGKMTSASIPSPTSGFHARDAKIYLPPAYFADPQPQLPVLILLSGQPGSPQDWPSAGRLAHLMDAFAATHRGLAPVVVVPDATGGLFADPLCVDSPRGHVDTYLARDVPAWITTHLTVDTDPAAWAVGGASYGGTCALQLATNHPDVYPTFLDVAGAAQPSLGDRHRTIAEIFGGDTHAFARVNPLDVMRTRRYPDSAGAIVVGADDADKADAATVYRATRAAGITSHYRELPGSHDWWLFRAALNSELPWLAQRIGLIAAAPPSVTPPN